MISYSIILHSLFVTILMPRMCLILAMPVENDIGVTATLDLSLVEQVPRCDNGDKCCGNMYWRFIWITDFEYWDHAGVVVHPVIASGSAMPYISDVTMAVFKCYDIRHYNLIPTGPPQNEVVWTGWYGIACSADKIIQILKRVPTPILPLITGQPIVWVFLDKVYCVHPFWAIVLALMMFLANQCVETQGILWQNLAGFYFAIVWTTNMHVADERPEGRPGPGPTAQQRIQVDVPSISLSVVSQDGKHEFKLNELYNVSALAWNNTLTEALWDGESFVIRACVSTGSTRVSLHLGTVFDPYYIYKKVSELKTLPHPKLDDLALEHRHQKALPP